MDVIRSLAGTGSCRIATAHDVVLNSECCYAFHTPYTSDQGIVVNLNSYMGTVQEMAMTGSNAQQELFVRIVKKRVEMEPASSQAENDENKEALPTKLGIGVEGGFQSEQEKYETISTHSVLVLERNDHDAVTGPAPIVVVELPYTDETKQSFPEMVSQSVDAILCHAGMTTQQDVKVWQLDTNEDKPISKYAASLEFVDNGVTINPDPSTWKCAKSGATENLWLNLSTGYIGGGRQHWDGSGGSNGALEHYQETGGLYPLVVKLGTITADIDTADCYSYAPDEDGLVQIPNLKELLEKRGIKAASLQKTVKSTAELEVELNANYAFDAITESGSELTPVSGPGLQGLQNLGNSCYMNSVLQLLLSGTVPELANRYGTTPNGSVTQHPFLTSVPPKEAPYQVLSQTTKVACALTSGVFCKPLNNDNTSSSENDPKYRLAPRMFKHLIGKDHAEFCTGQQQDAPQFLQYLLERLDRAEIGAAVGKGEFGNHVYTSSHLFAFSTTTRLACSADGKIKYKESSAPETIWSLRIPMDKAVVVVEKKEQNEAETAKDDDLKSPEHKRQKAEEDEKEPVPTVSFSACIDEWAKETTVEDIRWPHLQNQKHAALERHALGTCPRYLVVQLQRYQLGTDWVPIKLEVNVDMPQEIDLDAYKSTGPQEGEDLVPNVDDDEDGSGGAATGNTDAAAPPQPVAELDANALSQLMDMGFSLNSCKRALTAVGGSNVEAAMNWVFEHNTDPDFNDPLPEVTEAPSAAASSSGGNAGVVVDEAAVESLAAALGCFTHDQVRAALKETNGAADRAADWLFSHMDDLDGAIAALQSKESSASAGAAPSGAASSGTSLALDDGSGKYVMTGMISHIGKNTGSGHYVAHLKKDGKWVIINDEKVALSSNPPFEHAYLYLFQRKDTIGSPLPYY